MVWLSRSKKLRWKAIGVDRGVRISHSNRGRSSRKNMIIFTACPLDYVVVVVVVVVAVVDDVFIFGMNFHRLS